MSRAEVLLAAAQILAEKGGDALSGMCAAIAKTGSLPEVSRADALNACCYMESLFAEDAIAQGPAVAYWGNNFHGWRQQSKNRQCRILALCFAAAMAETGDL